MKRQINGLNGNQEEEFGRKFARFLNFILRSRGSKNYLIQVFILTDVSQNESLNQVICFHDAQSETTWGNVAFCRTWRLVKFLSHLQNQNRIKFYFQI